MSDFGAKVKAAQKEVGFPQNRKESKPKKKPGPPKGQSNSPATQWKPGKSANPGGRPHFKAISEAYRAGLETLHPDQKKYRGMTRAQVIAHNMLEAAEKGDTSAAREVTDRTEGKVPQGIEGPNGGAIPFMELTPEENESRIAELLAQAQQS